MTTIVFTSSSDLGVSISLNEDTMKHLQRHFDTEMPGSKFNIRPPERLLQAIVDHFPDTIRRATINESGCKIVSIVFPFNIGYSNVVLLDDLTEDELSTLRVIQRGETKARCISSQRIIPTKECQLILDEHNSVITIYPGELAPPLPASPDIHDEYWDNHVFIEPISK